jgi:uncharacterized Zn-binding protein involved in type VI secretion
MSVIVACLGDGSSHGGTLVSTNQDGRYKLEGIVVCANGCEHSCPIPGHGTTTVTAITTKSYVNGKLIVTWGSQAGCGAIIQPPDRKHYVE